METNRQCVPYIDRYSVHSSGYEFRKRFDYAHSLFVEHRMQVSDYFYISDYSGKSLEGVEETIALEPLDEKWRAFGWHVIECNGHDVDELYAAFEEAKTVKGQPTIVLAHTVKGKGVSFMEGKNGWHGKAVDDESYEKAMIELGGAK